MFDPLGLLSEEQREAVSANNEESTAVIRKYGDDGEAGFTPDDITNNQLKSGGLSNPGWMPFTTKWDLRQKYKGESDQDIALMESARRNNVRAQVLLAKEGLLDESSVQKLKLRVAFGMWELTAIAASIPFQAPSAASLPWVGRNLATPLANPNLLTKPINPIAAKGLAPSKINFSQRTVSGNVSQYVDDMVAGKWDWSRSGPIRIMKQDGKWVSYDNRRLMAAQQAGLKDIPFEVVDPKAIMPGSKKTWEQAFRKRFNDGRNLDAGGVVPSGGLSTQPSIGQ